jgi:chemotaxis protein methyltransferase CheR
LIFEIAMTDPECVQFLQWALPRLRLRWAGFRKVRKQVCRRLARRVNELGLPAISAYRAYLDIHPEEWRIVDSLCAITISRFYRNRATFQALERDVLPALARAALARGDATLRCWSIGCASGEEPYTVSLLWMLGLRQRFRCRLQITATDIDLSVIERARAGCYPSSSLKDLPHQWIAKAFTRSDGLSCLRRDFREPVVFLRQDVRTTAPEGPFDMILCRNIAFTYFDDRLQMETIERIRSRLVIGAALVVGSTESLPEGTEGFVPWSRYRGLFQRSSNPRSAGVSRRRSVPSPKPDRSGIDVDEP